MEWEENVLERRKNIGGRERMGRERIGRKEGVLGEEEILEED